MTVWDWVSNTKNLLGVIGGTVGLITLIYIAIKREISRPKSWLIEKTIDSPFFTNAYTSMLRRVLNWGDRLLVPPKLADCPMTDWRRAWNWKAYDRMLLLAVIYPIALPVLFWLLFNWPGDNAGALEIRSADLAERIQAGVVLAIASVVLVFNRPLARIIHLATLGVIVWGLRWTHLWRSAPTLLGLGLIRWGLILTVVVAVVVAVTVAGAVAGAVALAFAVAFAGAFAVAVVVAVAVAVVVAVTGAGAVAGALAVVVAVTGPGAGAGAGVGIFYDTLSAVVGETLAGVLVLTVVFFAPPAAFAVVLAKLMRAAEARNWSLPRLYTIGTLFILLVLALRASAQSYIDGEELFTLFFGILPILNAVFDFASLGLTRYLLRWSASRHITAGSWRLIKRLGLSALDLGGALVLLWGLCFACLVTVAAMNQIRPGDAVLLNLTDLRAQIDTHDREVRWLYVTILSTLLPSIVHLGIAWLGLLVSRFSTPLRNYTRRGLQHDNDDERTWARTAIAAALTAWVIIVSLIVGYGLYAVLVKFHLAGWFAAQHAAAIDWLTASTFGAAGWFFPFEVPTVPQAP